MSVRTCQLCGKPLSRLRVGGDGDFCSKEHRSQFNLRAGMDRLQEVNKVANLMRRRESAKQIAPASLLCHGAIGRRGFMDAQPARIDSTPRLIAMTLAEGTRPRITAYSDRCVVSAMNAAASALPARKPAAAIKIDTKKTRPVAPRHRHQVTFAFPRTPLTALRGLAVNRAGAHRELSNVASSGVRTHLGQSPAALRQTHVAALVAAARLQKYNARPVTGNALRVSSSLSFRAPAVQKLARQSALKMASALQPVTKPRSLAVGRVDFAQAVRQAAIRNREVAPKLPAPPNGLRSNAFPPRGAQRVEPKIFRDSVSLTPRLDLIQWKGSEPRLRHGKLSQTGSGFARRNGSHFFKIQAPPQSTSPIPHFNELAFLGRLEELRVPIVPYNNVLAAAAVGPEEAPMPAPATPAAPAPVLVARPQAVEFVKHEEHFDAGWDNWIGGVEDWKVDIAGVRTGSLALYLPTLDMSDYDLEFLARIDTRTVNWVVRAAGRDSYLRCTLTAVDGGEIEFSRAVVRGGAAEAPVVSTRRVAGKPRTTMTVRMTVAGPVFSVSIEGNTIDSWVDDRLATGGVGFMGAPEDRARIYWVRVCSPAAPNKEYTVQ